MINVIIVEPASAFVHGAILQSKKVDRFGTMIASFVLPVSNGVPKKRSNIKMEPKEAVDPIIRR